MPSAASREKNRPVSTDELNVVPRLYKQLGKLLDQLETLDVLDKDSVTVPQRISALLACGRVMKMFQDLKKGELNAGAGSAVAKYAAAFASPDATGWRDKDARSNAIEFDPDTDPYSDNDSLDA